jgi:hypothetical protein
VLVRSPRPALGPRERSGGSCGPAAGGPAAKEEGAVAGVGPAARRGEAGRPPRVTAVERAASLRARRSSPRRARRRGSSGMLEAVDARGGDGEHAGEGGLVTSGPVSASRAPDRWWPAPSLSVVASGAGVENSARSRPKPSPGSSRHGRRQARARGADGAERQPARPGVLLGLSSPAMTSSTVSSSAAHVAPCSPLLRAGQRPLW